MPNLINDFPELLTNSRFYVELTLDGSKDPVDAYFLECKGFKRNQDIIEVCEVTPQQWGQAKSGYVVRTKVPGNAKASNIVLRRGMTQSAALWKWFADVEQGNWAKQLRDGSLSIYDQRGEQQAVFQFQSAWPASYIVSDLNAGSNEIEIEEMEIAVATFTRQG